MHMGAWNMQRRTLLAALALPAPALANTPPLKLLGTGAVAASARDIAARFTAATGREVRLEIANAGVVARRLREGEAADLVLNSFTDRPEDHALAGVRGIVHVGHIAAHRFNRARLRPQGGKPHAQYIVESVFSHDRERLADLLQRGGRDQLSGHAA